MIDLSTNDVTKYLPRSLSRRDDDYVVVSQSQSAPTYIGFEEFLRNFQGNDHAATYRKEPIDSVKVADLFGSSKTESIQVTAGLVIGGYFAQPPIDDDSFVYFDE